MSEAKNTKFGGGGPVRDWRERLVGIGQAFLGLCGWLPSDSDDPATETTPLIGNLPRYRVMMVDADGDFLSSTSRHLADAGFDVLKAETATAALEQLRNAASGVEVVLLDYHLTGMNAEEALRHLRQLEPKPSIIGLTAQLPAQVSADFRERVDMLFSKPLDNAVLVQAIHKLIADNLGLSAPVS